MSDPEREIRDSIEALLGEFKNVQATGIVADEIWNRIVGPALDQFAAESDDERNAILRGINRKLAAERDELKARLTDGPDQEFEARAAAGWPSESVDQPAYGDHS